MTQTKKMKFIRYSRILTILAVLVGGLVLHTKAQDSPQDYLRVHNEARAAVNVGPMQLNETLASVSRNYAEQRRGDCNLVHSGGRYGENLAKSSRDLSGIAAVNLWVDEKRNYNYTTNSCNGVCGHYTQVVWRNSVRLGCAKVRCNNGGTFIVCNYDPPGNYANQKPY